jgi:hypothetical protein
VRAEVRRATQGDAIALASRLRVADRLEVQYATGREPRDVLLGAFTKPGRVFAIVEGAEVLGLFGVAPTPWQPGSGCPWMLCDEGLMQRHWRAFARQCHQWIDELGTGYAVLQNFVHAENEVHLRWLRWAEFELVHLIPQFGPSRKPFWLFRKVMRNRRSKSQDLKRLGIASR